MVVKQKKRGPRCHFCKKFGHMQRNCHEQERTFEGSNWHMRSKPQVNCAESRSRDHDSDCDEVGLVV